MALISEYLLLKSPYYTVTHNPYKYLRINTPVLEHYLKIWSLLMLYTHLVFLAFTSFVPGDSMSISYKKECLREKSQHAVVSASDNYLSSPFDLFNETEEKQKTEVKVCSLKLFCTAATESVTSLTPPLVSKAIKFNYRAYHSIAESLEPDPPKHC